MYSSVVFFNIFIELYNHYNCLLLKYHFYHPKKKPMHISSHSPFTLQHLQALTTISLLSVST